MLETAVTKEERMGGKFWLGVIGVTIACAIAGFVLFILIAEAWYRWGFLAMFLAIGALALLGGWIVDRRNAKRAY
jgi:hypothetical protein